MGQVLHARRLLEKKLTMRVAERILKKKEEEKEGCFLLNRCQSFIFHCGISSSEKYVQSTEATDLGFSKSKGEGVFSQVRIHQQTPSLHSSWQPPLFLRLRTCSAALVAISNTSRTPSLVLAEHSR